MPLSQLENFHTDIFTETDDSIFTDGSIDPLGLRMIWTSLGNTIFRNKLNTISTSIKFYTLNLFHHSVIQEVQKKHPEIFINKTGAAPYHTKVDLFDGIIIFLECLIAHVLVKEPQLSNDETSNDFFIPGLSKLKGKIENDKTDKIAEFIPVSKSEGILVRHILLGIHGRHKGPFQQMGLLNRFDYYSNSELWDEVLSMFNASNWKKLHNYLSRLIYEKVLLSKITGNKPIWIKTTSDIINTELLKLYRDILQDEQFRLPSLVKFWENHLGLKNTGETATLLYEVVKAEKGNAQSESVIKNLNAQKHNEELAAICAIEPFITLNDKVMSRLLQRGIVRLDDEIKLFVREKLKDPTVNTENIKLFLKDSFFNKEAIRRLLELIQIYEEAKNPIDEMKYLIPLISFHKQVMKQRGNLSWISINNNGDITQHRSFFYNDGYINFLSNNQWINDYYVNTVNSLYKGLYQ